MPNYGNSNSGYGSGKERSRRPKALNYRLMKAPDVYGGNPIHYQEWRGDFRGYVASQDDNIPWVKILDDIEARGKKVVSKELTMNYFHGMGYDEEDTWVVTTNLYNHLVKHTSGTTQGKVKLGGHKAVLETYRQLYQEGMKISKGTMFAMKSRVYEVQTAKTLRDVAPMIGRWEQDRDFLEEHGKYHMRLADQHHRLLTICPPEIRRVII